jgi:glycosyltransferase involved in cell wall biosynthesis
MLQLLDDPEARERMGRLGAERMRRDLSWDRSVEQLLLAYRRALGSGASPNGS